MRSILDSMAPNMLFFLSLHSYGQSIMYPWGYCRDSPKYWRELHTLATAGRTAIKTYNGREYRTGSISCLAKHTITGSVVDYVFAVLKTPLALVMELPSRELGFQPPVEMISQIGHESWFGIREMCKKAFDLRATIDRDTDVPPKPRPAKSSGGTSAGAGDSATSNIVRPAVTRRRSKKRSKRTLLSQHEEILEQQKRFLAPTTTRRTLGGHGDGPNYFAT